VACYRLEPDAILLAIRLTPRADRDAVDGVGVLADGRAVVHARVRAVPEDGAANAALVALLAKAFRRPKSAVAIASGGSARIKQVRIAGDPTELAAAVEGWPTKR
jgi:uncharacterized protein (TIGR00251 family)